MNFTHRLLTGCGSLALASGMAVSVAPEASATTATTTATTSTATYAAGEFQCGPNNWIGSLVPENPPGGADFHNACVRHDACYSPGSTTSRATCDTAFRNHMYNACTAAGKGATCKRIADLYYWAVRGAGRFYYKGSGLNN